MENVKEATIGIIRSLPEPCTLDEIMEVLWLRKKILIGQQQLLSGQSITHEEAKKRLEISKKPPI